MTGPGCTIDSLESGASIGFLVKRCGTLMTKLAERRFGSEPLSFTQWFVLATLNRYDHVSATTLSKETSHDIGALTRIIDALESGGLIRRDRSKRDRRGVEIALTAQGRLRMQEGRRAVVELLNELLAPYTQHEVDTLVALMGRMLSRLQEAEAYDEAGARSATRAASRPRRLVRAKR